jgi:hypothetical protein
MRHAVAVLVVTLQGSLLVQPKPLELKTPVAAAQEPFTQIIALRELSDGRMIVVDFEDKTVQLLDQQLALIKKIGRQGKGPGEYTMPMGLVPMPSDLTYLVDAMNQRLLPIKSDGSTDASIPFSSFAKGLLMMVSVAADSKGRLFFQGLAADIKAINADSVPILRADPDAKDVDTVGFFKPQKVNMSFSGGKVALGPMRMFAPEEAWTATVDGRVARIIPEPFHVIIYPENGSPVIGPAIKYEPIKVVEEERVEAKNRWQKGMAAGMAAAASAGARTSAGAFSAAEPEFAPTKPPFAGRTSAVAGPNGEIWVERNQPFADKAARYDRFDRAGKVIGQVRLNPNSRVLGFGKKAVYVARRDSDDLVYLERYDW